MSVPALQVAGLHKWFGALHALSDVSLSVERGERVIVMGPAGSGRSALMRCLTRSEPFEQGQVLIDGDPLPSGGADLVRMRQRLGIVTAETALFPHFSVLQNCSWALIRGCGLPADEAEAVALAALDRVHMADRGDHMPARLNPGEQRRVAIARALSLEPEVLLLDEPTAGLPRASLGEVRDAVAQLADAGLTMLCATDDMRLARRIADHVIYMEAGRIVETDTATRFFAGPSSARARAFVQRLT